jgi:sodium/hydrogen exchanger 3
MLLVVLFFLNNIIVLVNGYQELVGSQSDKKKKNSADFESVSGAYQITLWILLGCLAKICFHLSHKFTKNFPESCLLIILGLVVGGFLKLSKSDSKAFVLDSHTFFIFLLPAIILEAGYFMPNRPFFNNIRTILLLAIANTLFNTLMIGLTLNLFAMIDLFSSKFEVIDLFIFASLISAVDPVAVLATFVEIHVNDMLYIVVFGESLLNDAVSVVLYRMFDNFSDTGTLTWNAAIDGVLNFFIVSICGFLIGILFGFIACFTTKFTENTPILEPLIIISYSYLAYLTAEMFHFSGIIA